MRPARAARSGTSATPSRTATATCSTAGACGAGTGSRTTSPPALTATSRRGLRLRPDRPEEALTLRHPACGGGQEQTPNLSHEMGREEPELWGASTTTSLGRSTILRLGHGMERGSMNAIAYLTMQAQGLPAAVRRRVDELTDEQFVWR